MPREDLENRDVKGISNTRTDPNNKTDRRRENECVDTSVRTDSL